jgi:hypothetical protein
MKTIILSAAILVTSLSAVHASAQEAKPAQAPVKGCVVRPLDQGTGNVRICG